MRVFVAMPATDMGANSTWKDPGEIGDHFYRPICQELRKKLKRPVEIVIEKEKPQPAIIHDGMFREAWEADVFIADLSGNNANVYLELGVRWAVSDGVTVVVTQSVEDRRFNAESVRAIPYSQTPTKLQEAINRTVAGILHALEHPEECVSPVRRGSELVTIIREDLDELKAENTRLVQARGDDLLTAATVTDRPNERLHLLRQCVKANKASFEGWLRLGKELQMQGQYEEAKASLRTAANLRPDSSDVYRELGVVHNRSGDDQEERGNLHKAEGEWKKGAESFAKSVSLAPSDAETLSNWGGALRRLGMLTPLSDAGRENLKRARDNYAEASKIEKDDTYALLNVAKLSLLLSRGDPQLRAAATDDFEKVRPLCEYRVSQAPDDYWKCFDFADALLFCGRIDEGRQQYDKAIQKVPNEHRKTVFASVAGPLENLCQLGVLSPETEQAVRDILDALKQASEC